MGDDKSSTWPTVIELALTPGEGPLPPEPFGVDVAGAGPELPEDVGVELGLEEHEASPRASTHSPARSAPRSLTLPARTLTEHERVSLRFTSTPPPGIPIPTGSSLSLGLLACHVRDRRELPLSTHLLTLACMSDASPGQIPTTHISASRSGEVPSRSCLS